MVTIEQILEQYIDAISDVTSKAIEVAEQETFGVYQDVIQETEEESEEIIEQVKSMVSDMVTEHAMRLIIGVLEKGDESIFETEEFYSALFENLAGYAAGAYEVILREIGLSRETRRKLKKGLKYGAIGLGLAGAAAGAAYAATHPEQVKHGVEIAKQKIEQGLDVVKNKISSLFHSASQQANNQANNVDHQANNVDHQANIIDQQSLKKVAKAIRSMTPRPAK